MDPSLMYEAVKHGGVDVISAFTTDGRIKQFDLVLLTDDRGAIPPYDAIILAGPRLVQEEPMSVSALEALDGRIDDQAMRQMNSMVDEEHQKPADVARSFLRRLLGSTREQL
jgi:osmoprotectant transport system permease protein